MPHVVVQYTLNLETQVDMPALCREIADALIAVRDEKGGPLFPVGGTRVLAYPAQVYAVAVRIAGGRSDAKKKEAGDAVLAKVQARFALAFERKHVGVTIQVDESPGQVYDAKHNNLNPLFNK